MSGAVTIEMREGVCGSCGRETMIGQGGRCLECVGKSVGAGAQLGNWPDDEVEYVPAFEVQKTAERLLADKGAGAELWLAKNAKVYYQFRKEMPGRKLAECRLVKALYKGLISGNVDFIITADWTAWKKMDAGQKDRVVYHELCHIGQNATSGAWMVVKHDFEGFVNEWIRFRGVIKAERFVGQVFGVQTDLFAGPMLPVEDGKHGDPV